MDAPAASSTTSSPIADFFDLLAKRHATMRTSANVQRADKERRAELTKALRLESDQFNGQDERALLIYGADEALSAAIAPGATFIAMAVRCGFSIKGLRCAIHFRAHDGADLVRLYTLPGSAGKSFHATLAAVLQQASTLDAQVYRTPSHGNSTRDDTYWGANWSADKADDYSIYRDAIDGLIEEAIVHHSSAGSGGKDGLRIVEICGGDGALAARLLQLSTIRIASYYWSERNVSLVVSARQRLETISSNVNVQVVKASANEGTAYGENANKGTADVLISAGSVLNGQVGTPETAEFALRKMSECLRDGGILIATGVSGSWLHPAMMRRHGLDVVLKGSCATERTMSATAAAGVDHGWGRFPLFVLRKRAAGEQEQDDAAPRCPLFDAVAGV